MRLPQSLWPAAYRSVTDAQWPPGTREDAERFVRACIGQGLLSILIQSSDTPRVVTEALDGVRAMEYANLERTRALQQAFHRLAEILGDEPFIVLKGCDYAYRLYAKPHLRQMADIDFLVPRARFSHVVRRLTEAGLRQEFPAGAASRMSTHHEAVFRMGGITIEPHQAFIQRPRHAIDYEGIWGRRVRCAIDGLSTFRLSDDDAILYAALSLAIKGFDVPLIRYLDVELLFEAFWGDLAQLVSRAVEWRMERAFFAAIDQTVSIFPELRPKLESTIESLLTPRRRRFLRRAVLPAPFDRAPGGRRRQLWRKFELMDGMQERAGFILYHAWATIAGAAKSRGDPQVP